MANLDIKRELDEGIAYFEQILNVLPGDRTALEFLCVACQQVGDTAKVLKYALALAEVTLREKNVESARDLIEKLKLIDDPKAKAAVLKLEILVAPEPMLKFEKPEDRVTSATPSLAAKAELALLEKLVADGVLTRSLVQMAFDQLENLPKTRGEFLISALSILEKENLTGAAEAFAAVADAAHAPPVPLEAFELVPGDVRKLPDDLVRVRGVVPFAKLGDEWAVAVLNPLDEELRREVIANMGAKCHFFLALPSAVEKVMERIFSEEEASESPAPASSEPVAAEPPLANPLSKPHVGVRRPAK